MIVASSIGFRMRTEEVVSEQLMTDVQYAVISWLRP